MLGRFPKQCCPGCSAHVNRNFFSCFSCYACNLICYFLGSRIRAIICSGCPTWPSSSLFWDLRLSWQSPLDSRTSEQHPSGCGKRGRTRTERQGHARDRLAPPPGRLTSLQVWRGPAVQRFKVTCGTGWVKATESRYSLNTPRLYRLLTEKEEDALAFVRKENAVMPDQLQHCK